MNIFNNSLSRAEAALIPGSRQPVGIRSRQEIIVTFMAAAVRPLMPFSAIQCDSYF
jgi:hypothetical protein